MWTARPALGLCSALQGMSASLTACSMQWALHEPAVHLIAVVCLDPVMHSSRQSSCPLLCCQASTFCANCNVILARAMLNAGAADELDACDEVWLHT